MKLPANDITPRPGHDTPMLPGSCAAPAHRPALVDPFGRTINYLRISLTDRCNFRCVYCMAEDMQFLPRANILTLEEVAWIARAFAELGVRRFRFTGGEPLIRNGLTRLVRTVAALPTVEEVTLTTNGALLAEHAQALADAGIHRINVSLDSLQPARFRQITRTGSLKQVLRGIQAARQAGIGRIKLNAVIMRGHNEEEVVSMVEYAVAHQLDISFIEEMPMGHVGERHRGQAFVSSEEIRAQLARCLELVPTPHQSPGPSRYYQVVGESTRVGFISPHSENFCASCNRVRLTAEGRLLLCLGNEHSLDLRALVRHADTDMALLQQQIRQAIMRKPERHHFSLQPGEQLVRFMNMTGG